MARFVQALIANDFATGVTYYEDSYPTEEMSARMVLQVAVEGQVLVHAIVDTGSPWCILDPDIVERLGVINNVEYAPEEKMLIRGFLYEGKLLRMRIGLEAEYGHSLGVESTVFVPSLFPGDVWPYPNFVGLDGFLSRIRFAVDPTENAFYFGPLRSEYMLNR
jgi:hypothetical protein